MQSIPILGEVLPSPEHVPRITRPSVASQHLAKVFNNGRAAVVPPRGRSIRRPPLGGAQRAEPSKLITQIIRSQKFYLQNCVNFGCYSNFPSLNLSPGARRPPPTWPQKVSNFDFWDFFLLFLSPKTHVEKCFEKNAEKKGKIMILRSQNLPQTLPK